MKTLQEIYKKYAHGCDKGTVHSYIEIYDTILEPFRSGAAMLEVGVFKGYSLLMWEEYFINSLVSGVDITSSFLKVSMLRPDKSQRIFLLNSTDEAAIERSFSGQKFSVVIDDGSHRMRDQINTYRILKKYLQKDFIYVIEDIARIDRRAAAWLALDPEMDIMCYDLRGIKNRRDDVMIVIRNKK
jgi:hypothetical protein